jgi:hypothetical protein
VLGRINQLCERLAAAGPGAAIDVDQAALRVTLDVIGLVRYLSRMVTWCVCSGARCLSRPEPSG